MDTRSFDLYDSRQDALDAGVPDEHLVEVTGNENAIAELRANLEKVRGREAEHGKRKPQPRP